jgi:hypothetical protein
LCASAILMMCGVAAAQPGAPVPRPIPGWTPPPAPAPAPPPSPEALAEAERVLDVAGQYFEQARQLRDLLSLARELAYADPRQVEWALASAYGELLADPIMGPLLSNLAAQYRGGFGRVEMDAGAGGDVDVPAAANVAVAASYELPLCRVVGARAAALGGWEPDGGVASYVLTGSACLPLPANTLEVAYTRRGNVRTSVVAGPVVLEDRRSGDIYDINLRFYRWRGAAHQIDVMPFQIHIDVTRNEDPVPGDELGAISSFVEGAPVIWRRRGKGLAGDDQVYRFMAFAMHYQDDDAAVGGRDAGVFTIYPLTMDGLHVTPDVVASVGGGFVTAQGLEGEMALVEEGGAAAYFELATARGRLRASARAAREYVPTFDAQYVIDDRVTTRVDLSTDRVAASLAVFAARDEVRRAGGRVDPELVTGGALDVAYALGRGLHVLGRVEAANAIVAGTSTDPVTVERTVLGSASLAWHWERRWPARPLAAAGGPSGASGVRSGP